MGFDVAGGRDTSTRGDQVGGLQEGSRGLGGAVKDQMRLGPFSGVVFVFRSKRADRVKLLWWDGTGVCLLSKRLEDGRFQWPKIQDGTLRMSAAQLLALLEGLDWRRAVRAAGRGFRRRRTDRDMVTQGALGGASSL